MDLTKVRGAVLTSEGIGNDQFNIIIADGVISMLIGRIAEVLYSPIPKMPLPLGNGVVVVNA